MILPNQRLVSTASSPLPRSRPRIDDQDVRLLIFSGKSPYCLSLLAGYLFAGLCVTYIAIVWSEEDHRGDEVE